MANRRSAEPADPLPPSGPDVYVFGRFRLEVAERRLLSDGAALSLPPKVLQTLVVLVENAGRLVTKDVLIERIWPDTFVVEVTLAHNVSVLRKKLGEAPGGGPWIETIAKSGYRFVGEVRRAERLEGELPQPVVEAPPPAAKRRPRRARLAMLSAAAIAAVAAAAGWIARERPPPAVARPATPPAITSIAVLPFRSLSPTDDEAFVELGLAEALIARLGGISSLTVRPLSAVQRYRGSPLDALQIGRALRVDAVLDGTVQRRGNTVRVTADLRRLSDGRSAWSAVVTDVTANLLVAQDSLAGQLLGTFWPTLPERERPPARAGDSAAYELYLKGRYLWNRRTAESLEKAVVLLEQAVERDPGLAMAWVTLADAHALLAGAREPRQQIIKSRTALERALALDDGLGEAHSVIAMNAANWDYDWERMETEFRRAIELSPGDPHAYHRLGEILALLGRFEEGLALLARAKEIDPLSPVVATDTAKVLFMMRRYEECAAATRAVLELEPDFALARFFLGASLGMLGRRDASIAELARYTSLDPSLAAKALAGASLAFLGETARAEELLAEELAASARGEPVYPFFIACIYSGLGRKAESLDWLERAHREGSVLLGVGVNPWLDALRDEPRFRALCQKLRLPPVESASFQRTATVSPGH